MSDCDDPWSRAAPLLADLPTPLLVLDERRLRANVDAMAALTRSLGVGLRPHAKAHKSPEIARLQLAAGARGITVSTLAEAEAMVTAGVGPVLLANQAVGHAAEERLAVLSRGADAMVLVDDAANVRALSAAASRLGVLIEPVVELDVGMGRCGVRSVRDACELAALVEALPGLRLAGIHGYEGHCSDEPDRDRRAAETTAALDLLGELAGALRGRGLACDVVSAGSTGTWHEAGAHPAVTEIQPGSYVFMDRFHRPLVDDFRQSLAVVATVLSVNGDLAVLDAGRKAVGAELAPPGLPEGLTQSFLHEEHLGVRQARPTLRPGDRVTITPGYAPGTVNLYDRYTVLTADGGVASWTICARHGS